MSLVTSNNQPVDLPAEDDAPPTSDKAVTDVRIGTHANDHELAKTPGADEAEALSFLSNGVAHDHQENGQLPENGEEVEDEDHSVNEDDGTASSAVNGVAEPVARPPSSEDWGKKEFARGKGLRGTGRGRSTSSYRQPRSINGTFRQQRLFPEGRFVSPAASPWQHYYSQSVGVPFPKHRTQAPALPTGTPRVSHETEMSKTNLYIRGLQSQANDVYLRELCSRYGQIKSTKAIVDKVTGKCKGYGFVDFENSQAAHKALQGLLQQNMDVQLARLRQDTDTTNLYLANLPLDMDDRALQELLSPYGEIVSTRILQYQDTGQSKGVGFCRMETREACESVIDQFNGKTLQGQDVPLTVKFADAGRKRFMRDQPRQYRLTMSNTTMQYDYSNRAPPTMISQQTNPHYIATNSLTPYQMATATQYYGQQFVHLPTTAMQSHLHGAMAQAPTGTDMSGLSNQLAHLTVQVPNAPVGQQYVAQMPSQYWSGLATSQQMQQITQQGSAPSQQLIPSSQHSLLGSSQIMSGSQNISSGSPSMPGAGQQVSGLSLPQAVLQSVQAEDPTNSSHSYSHTMNMPSVDDYALMAGHHQLATGMVAGSSASLAQDSNTSLQVYSP